MPLVCTGQTLNQVPFVCGPHNDRFALLAHNVRVANDERNYLKAWREFRGLTQEELADKAETTKAVISLLENEKRPLSSKWLRKFAEILKTQPGHILDHDPNEVNADIFDLWARIGKEDRQRAARVLRSLTGTDG
jgi:transcriptional regulator with XRE-family HTH domain